MTKPSLLHTCDICKFRAKNSYIFKRHLHRCYSLHGIASPRSSPRIPLRLKGTENLEIKAINDGVNEDLDEGDEDDAQGIEDDAQGIEDGATEDMVDLDSAHSSQEDDDAQDTTAEGIETLDLEDNEDNSILGGVDTESDVNTTIDDITESTPETTKIVAPYVRTYKCSKCDFQCKGSRDNLFHQRDVHGNTLTIHECPICDYASHYANKIERHMVVHKEFVSMDDYTNKLSASPDMDTFAESEETVDSQTELEGEEAVRGSGRLRVKPIKLSRLNVKMPFKVSDNSAGLRYGSPSMSSGNQPEMENPTPSSERTVYKKVMRPDGSMVYECTHCMYYSPVAFKMKKHYELCHSKPFKCPHCDFTTLGKGILNEHLMTHEGFGYTKCPVCSYVTAAKWNYEKHKIFHEAEYPYKCIFCNFGSDAEGKIKRHMTTQHTPYAGSHGTICNEDEFMDASQDSTFESSPPRKNFLQSPPDQHDDEPLDPQNLTFRCPKCTMQCNRRGNFTRHLTTRHNYNPKEASRLSKIMTNRILKAGKGRLTVSAYGIVKATTNEKLKCPQCPYRAKWPSEFRKHMQVHTALKRYKCNICPNKYKYFRDLNLHMRKDHNMEPPDTSRTNEDDFFTRPDINPLTKPGPSDASMSQAVFPGNPGPFLSTLPPESDADVSMGDEAMEQTMEDSGDTFADLKLYLEESPQKPSKPKATTTSPSSSNVTLRDGSFVCEYPNCEFRATISDRMEAHLAMHLNIKKFQCPTCGKRTNWKWDIVKHMVKVHNNPSAGVEDVITLGLEEAKATIGQYMATFDRRTRELTVNQCSLCDFKSLEKNRVVRHLSAVHKTENGKVITRIITNPSEFQCGDSSIQSPQKEPQNFLGVGPSDGNDAMLDESSRTSFTKNSSENSQDGENSNGKFVVSPFTGKSIKTDSKYSNPRAHGYIKPFKCSICGVRSNWKWDLKKHLRSKHPNCGGFVIMLSIEEASQTYGKECSLSHPTKHQTISPSQNHERASPFASTPSPTSSSENNLFKLPFNVKEEVLEEDDESSKSENFFPQSPSSASRLTDTKKNQWKCSGCDYVTNWRRNIARHVRRKHIGQDIKCIAINRQPAENSIYKSQLSLSSFFARKRNPTPSATSSRIANNTIRRWNCPKCSFESELRTHIINHMQTHEMKPFMCGVCKVPFMNRGPLHQHLQRVHRCPDYIKQCKVIIKYADEEVEGHSTPAQNGGAALPSQPKTDRLETRGGAQYINSFFCRLCNLESHDREEIITHLETIHETSDNQNNILKIQKRVGLASTPQQARPTTPVAANNSNEYCGVGYANSKKVHYCHVCPYRSQKKQMLAFHMTYHRPTVANRFKCKYCPYYVGNMRLLHAHQRKWHESGYKTHQPGITWNEHEQKTPTGSPSKGSVDYDSSPGKGKSKWMYCEKCPYKTSSKNDFIYHKQFHRPKRSAEYKCEYCDYWVVHKRLLKQHMRLHDTEQIRTIIDTVSNFSSPAKSFYSDPGLVNDPSELTELAAIKQKMISSKITPSLSAAPSVSPMKIASSVKSPDGGPPDYVLRGGVYRKLHKCRKCPYTNIRSRNMQLHELMHGPRASPHPLMKCPYCDYYVGSKGLLSHHMKCHQKNYGDTPEKDNTEAETPESSIFENGDTSDVEILPQQKVDTLLQISRFKRFGCERCPYASAKRQYFERHIELHGSRQRYTCQYCDYSVPSSALLQQHTKLHLQPNQNLLATQSVSNLHHLGDVPADVALSSALPPADNETTVNISVIHDNLGLYENSIYDSEPKKLYRCDRCPYANLRRDYLLSHLKFHMVASSLSCPYCDYSAPKQPLLTQHIRVHFCPLPELSEWLLENGQKERETSHRQMDLGEAFKVAKEYQNADKNKYKLPSDKITVKTDKTSGKENTVNGATPETYVCQYCDREYPGSEALIKHELQHLIGNHFERSEYVDRNKKEIEKFESEKASDKKDGAPQHNGDHSQSTTPSKFSRRWSINSGGRASPGSSKANVTDHGDGRKSEINGVGCEHDLNEEVSDEECSDDKGDIKDSITNEEGVKVLSSICEEDIEMDDVETGDTSQGLEMECDNTEVKDGEKKTIDTDDCDKEKLRNDKVEDDLDSDKDETEQIRELCETMIANDEKSKEKKRREEKESLGNDEQNSKCDNDKEMKDDVKGKKVNGDRDGALVQQFDSCNSTNEKKDAVMEVEEPLAGSDSNSENDLLAEDELSCKDNKESATTEEEDLKLLL